MKVILLKDNTYQVVKLFENIPNYECPVLYQGSLSDCEAFIRLTENGYL